MEFGSIPRIAKEWAGEIKLNDHMTLMIPRMPRAFYVCRKNDKKKLSKHRFKILTTIPNDCVLTKVQLFLLLIHMAVYFTMDKKWLKCSFVLILTAAYI